ncbi:hypothetical protein H4J46_16490 [Colwellia sp. MB02u-6]|uniref:hypothetical protein n=1 Tax=Colwellia sp. MB02u-6 TaxID=2759824 RepID=UPI0015F4E8C5|nr:hypothetical protein [Colwellia sp. MB02u-6]MBA6329511.1 hypothetical protein [Colwellia sp. MB02u-6]
MLKQGQMIDSENKMVWEQFYSLAGYFSLWKASPSIKAKEFEFATEPIIAIDCG